MSVGKRQRNAPLVLLKPEDERMVIHDTFNSDDLMLQIIKMQKNLCGNSRSDYQLRPSSTA